VQLERIETIKQSIGNLRVKGITGPKPHTNGQIVARVLSRSKSDQKSVVDAGYLVCQVEEMRKREGYVDDHRVTDSRDLQVS
jgi:hypothetical protein